MSGLTKSQGKIFEFISHFIKTKGHSPTFREIQSQFNLASLGSVYTYIKALKKKGKLLDGKRAPIALEKQDVTESWEGFTLPFIGYLAAGFPIETFHQSQSIAVPPSLVPNPEDTYVLKARGDTLIDEHIADGDMLLIEARNLANEGELIVATLQEQNTIVKRYYSEGSYVRLETGEGKHDPIILPADQLQIQGVIVGLFRAF